MHELLYIFVSFAVALCVTAFAIPPMVRVSLMLKLFAVPNGRSATIEKVPYLGGMAIFLGFVLGMTLTSDTHFLHESIYIFAAGLIMLLVGLKDDTVTMPAWKRLIAEIVIALILILWGNFRFTHLHGFMGIEEIPMVIGVPLTVFVYIVIINAINLVDGIDGLASGLVMFAASVMGVWFFLTSHFEYCIIAFSLVGGLFGFFLFNFYGTKNKIFMGDTGSLVVGTIVAILVIQFNQFNIDQTQPYAVSAAPAVSFGLLIYPLLDTLRVFTIRIIQKKSPFTADKNHAHHRLLAMGMTHQEATYWILSVNGLFTLAVFYFSWIGIVQLMIFNILVGGFLLLMPSYILGSMKKVAYDDPYQQIILFNMRVKEVKKKVVNHPSSLQVPMSILEQVKRISFW